MTDATRAALCLLLGLSAVAVAVSGWRRGRE